MTKNKNKTINMLVWVISVFILFGCTYSNKEDGAKEGLISTSLLNVADITNFETAEDTDYYITAPCTFLQNNYTYIIRNFPANMLINAENINKQVSNNNTEKTIEVYNDYNFEEKFDEIELIDLKERNVTFYNLIIGGEQIYILVRERENDQYYTKVLINNYEGRLVNEYVLPIDYAYDVILREDCCYYIKNQFVMNANVYKFCLIRYNFDTEEETYIDDDAIIVFSDSRTVYYIKPDHSEMHDETSSILYQIDEDTQSIIYIRDIDMHGEITSAAYDKKHHVLYCVDYSKIYKYSEDDVECVFTVADSFVEVKQCLEKMITLQIGHNQVSVYQLDSAF